MFLGVRDVMQQIDAALMWNAKACRKKIIEVLSFIDSTGIHNLEQLYQRTQSCGIQLVLSGVNHHVFHALEKAGVVQLIGRENIRDHINGALARAAEIVGEKTDKHPK